MHRLLRLTAVVVVACAVANVHAAQTPHPTVVQRFLARGEEPPVEYRALRRLEAHNPKFKQSAWMIAWTEYDHVRGFRYEVVDEGGSGYIRSKVLRAALEGEQKIWADRAAQKASFTNENYLFDEGATAAEGLAALGGKPRRKDVLLVEGSGIAHPAEGGVA